jgi:hypothetical protein
VRAELRERLLDFARSHPQVLGAAPTEPRPPPLPGRRRLVPETPAERDWAAAQLQHVERTLFDGAGGCRFCHQETTAPAARPDGLPVIPKAQVPTRWLTHARFRHQSHRMKNCIDCHPAVSSHSASDVLIPSVRNCAGCHHPGSGTRSDCIGCHDYHHSPERVGPSGLPVAEAPTR